MASSGGPGRSPRRRRARGPRARSAPRWDVGRSSPADEAGPGRRRAECPHSLATRARTRRPARQILLAPRRTRREQRAREAPVPAGEAARGLVAHRPPSCRPRPRLDRRAAGQHEHADALARARTARAGGRARCPASSPETIAESTSPASRRSVSSATRRRSSSSATTVTAWWSTSRSNSLSAPGPWPPRASACGTGSRRGAVGAGPRDGQRERAPSSSPPGP